MKARGEPVSPPAEGFAHRPRSVDEVIRIVRSARHSKQALYPVSTGRNWGYGGATPPSAGSVLLYLDGMKEIRNAADISPTNPVAVIEPGVTQGQLHDFLQRNCPDLSFNVTGSARQTSIIGNALDGGVGYLGPRREDLFGLEIVTGAGELLRTGFRRLGDGTPLAFRNPYGLGPHLDGLFFQGSFGIVTSACLRLVHRPARQAALRMVLSNPGRLADFVDVLAQLKSEGVLASVTHIANRARARSTLMRGAVQYLVSRGLEPGGAEAQAVQSLDSLVRQEWAAMAAIGGSAAQLRLLLQETRRRLRGIAAVDAIDDGWLKRRFRVVDALGFIVPAARRAAAVLAAVRPLHGLTVGVPSDVAVENLLWQCGETDRTAAEFEDSRVGILYVNPALPMEGGFVQRTVASMSDVARQHGHELYVTLNIETSTSLVAVANLLFDRCDPVAAANAARCADAIYRLIRGLGLEVYRARADMMPAVVSGDPGYWQHIRALKQHFDPDGIIAPGRYCPLD